MPTTWPLYGTNFPSLAYSGQSASTETTLALDSAYTYASAGDAVMFNFVPQESANLTDFWIKVTGYTGTWGSTDGVINVEIRQGLNGSSIPGTTATGTFTITLDGSTTGWIKKTGLSIALTAGQMYSVVIGDADGGGVNFVTIAVRYTVNLVATLTPILRAVTTATNGFSSAGTESSQQPAFCAKVGSIVYGGSGVSSVAASSSNSNEKGMRFQPTEDCTLVGYVISNVPSNFYTSNITAFKTYADGTAPGGTTLSSVAPQTIASGTTPAPNVILVPAASRVDLIGGTWYRSAVDPSTNITFPSKCTVGGSPDADVLSVSFPFNGNAHYIEESGGSWDDSQTTVIPTFGPVLLPKTAAAGGGGLLTHPGMTGGMRG